MTEIADLSTRLTALETVMRQLLTHLAAHTDDPSRWVATRRVLALHAVRDDPSFAANLRARADMEGAIADLFGQVEAVLGVYDATSEAAAR